MLKDCSKCGSTLSVDRFNKDSRASDKLSSQCKGCHSVACAKSYQKNRQYYREYRKDYYLRNRYSKRARKEIAKLFFGFYLGGNCRDCAMKLDGQNWPAFDFDHMRDKKHLVGKIMTNSTIYKTLKEVDKCELRCSNCHRIRTQGVI